MAVPFCHMGMGDFVPVLDSLHIDAACEGIDFAKEKNDTVPSSKSEADDPSLQELVQQSKSPAWSVLNPPTHFASLRPQQTFIDDKR